MKRRLVLTAALIGAVASVPVLAGGAAGRTTQATQKASVTLKEFSITSTLLKPAVFGKESKLKPGRTTEDMPQAVWRPGDRSPKVSSAICEEP